MTDLDPVTALVERVKTISRFPTPTGPLDAERRTGELDRLARIVELLHPGQHCNHGTKCCPSKDWYLWCIPCRARAIAEETT